MKRILIAGAGGYVGQNLIKALGGKAEITGIDVYVPSTLNPNPTTLNFIRPEDLPKLEGSYDVFYNFAWVGKGGPQRADYELQTKNVLNALAFYKEAVRLGCKRYICAGTIGELMVQLPECAKIRSQNFVYINAKNYLHSLLNNIEEPCMCKVIWARLGNLYGGGDSGGNLVAYTVDKLQKGEKAVFGPAEQPYDFVHAEDCARALAALGLSDSLESDEFYVGAGDVRLLKDYLRAIGRVRGREDLVCIGGRPDDGTRYKPEWFSIKHLMDETGYKPSICFEDGIREKE